MWLLLACAHTPGVPAREARPEVYGDPGLGVAGWASAAWMPGGFAVFDGHTIQTYDARARPRASWPTPCAPEVFRGVRIPPTSSEVVGSEAFGRLVVTCRPLEGPSRAYFVDPASGAAVDMGAGFEAVGTAALFVRDGEATWRDADGRALATRAIPEMRGGWATAGTVWAALPRADDAAVWWLDLATGAPRTFHVGGNVLALATDGHRIAVGTSAGVRWVDAATGADLGTTPGYASELGFVEDVLWMADLRGWRRTTGPSAPVERAETALPSLDLATGPSGVLGTAWASVGLWRADGTPVSLPAPWWDVEDAGLSADGRVLAVADVAGRLTVVDRRTGTIRSWPVRDLDAIGGIESLARPSPDGSWIAVGSRPALFSPDTGGVVTRPEGGVVNGGWTADGCFQGFYQDGSNSYAPATCIDPSNRRMTQSAPGRGPRHAAHAVYGTSVYIPASHAPGPFAVSRRGDRVAVVDRERRVQEFASGRHAPPEAAMRYGLPIATIAAWPAEGPNWRVAALAYDAEGRVVSLLCDPAREGRGCRRRVGADAPAEPTFPPVSRLTADGGLVVSWSRADATIRSPDGDVLARAALVGAVRSVATGDRAAAFVLEDGRVQVLEAR